MEGLAAGADDYMVKPFSARELVARVEGSLRLAKARRELARADRQRVELALDLTQDRLRLALESAHMGLFDWEVPDGALIWSPECKALFGLEADAPVSYPIFLAAVHADDRERVDLACRRTLDPEVRAPYDIEFRVISPEGVRWVMARGKGYFEGDAPRRFTGTVADVSARKEVETRLRMLVDELSHRVKNTLAVVQSITEQTFRAAGGDPATRAALIGRLQSLAETHTLLTRTNWESVDLAELVKRAIEHLAVKEARRFDAQGPHVRLTPKASLAMGLVLHELSTNALKHGAWASEQGSVSVRWRVEGENLELGWDETTANGRVAPPTRTSFGSRLIRQAVQYDLGGEVTKDFRPGGLFCVLRVPLAKAAV